MKKILLQVFTSIFFITFKIVVQAQVIPAIQWDKTFGGTDQENLLGLQQTQDGGFILGGWSMSQISTDKSEACKGRFDYWVLKLDANGKKIWDKTYGGSEVEGFYGLLQTKDGGYLLGGHSFSQVSGDKSQPSIGGTDIWLVKLDANGNKQWDKALGGLKDDILYSLIQTSDGGFIFGGYSSSEPGGDKSQACFGGWDYWVVKIDANGNKQWDQTFGGLGLEQVKAIKQTADGGYILGGDSDSGISGNKTAAPKGNKDYWVIKLDANGLKLWEKVIGGSGGEELYAVQQATDGGYILGGFSQSGISGDKSEAVQGSSDFWVVKLDANGNKIWDKTIGGNGQDDLKALELTNGGYILGGTSNSDISGNKTQANNGYGDFWLVKIDTTGKVLWDKTIGGTDLDNFQKLQQTADGGYILGGDSHSNISFDKTQISQGYSDYWVVKLGPEFIPTPDKAGITIGPNPNQGEFKIQLDDIAVPVVEVTLYNSFGRKVKYQEIQVKNKRISEKLQVSSSKGIYLLQVKAGDKILTQKVLVE